MSKQDRQGVRTAVDLERKWKFGETFAHFLGIAEEAKKAVEDAKNATADLDKKLTPEEIFNLLTNNGKVQGIYRGDDGQIYLNASYIMTGELVADLIKSGLLSSADGSVKFDLDQGQIITRKTWGSGEIIFMYTNNGIDVAVQSGNKQETIFNLSVQEDSSGNSKVSVVFGESGLKFGGLGKLNFTSTSDVNISGSKVTINDEVINSTENWETTLSNSGSYTHTCKRTPVAVIVGAQYQGSGLVTGIWTPATSGLENSMYGITGGVTDFWPTTVTISGKNVTVKRGGNASLKYFVTAIMQMD